MPTYIGLFNFTEQGIKNVKQSPDRLDAAKAAARFALALGRGGNVRGNTMKAFTEAEYRKIVADLP